MAKNYIYHNGILLSEDELMHWKYIKRERKNGRWVYYYNDDKLNSKRRTVDEAMESTDNADRHYRSSVGVRDNFKDFVRAYNHIRGLPEGLYNREHGETIDEYNIDVIRAKNRLDDENDKLIKAKKDLANYEEETKIRRYVAEGAAKVANALSKFASKFDKKKKKAAKK